MTFTEKIGERVTQMLLERMSQGIIPWQRTWSEVNEDAISHTTGNPYSFLNQCLLGFRPGEYLTFNQVKKEGGKVKKGAKAGLVVFWASQKMVKIEKENEAGEKESEFKIEHFQFPILKCYNVFHIDDCDGVKVKHIHEELNNDFSGNMDAELIATEYCRREGIKLSIEKRNSASYSPSLDMVKMPLREQFAETEEYYATLYHELTHSTGHKNRLNRLSEERLNFGKEVYSREELTAEIGSAMCLSYLGMDNDRVTRNHVAYLQHWSQFLKNDPMAFIVAAGKAEKAVNLIFNRKDI